MQKGEKALDFCLFLCYNAEDLGIFHLEQQREDPTMKNNSNRLAVKMLIAMVAGIAFGLGFMFLRERLGATSEAWMTINDLLFQDITAAGAEKAIGTWYVTLVWCWPLWVLQKIIRKRPLSFLIMLPSICPTA